MNIFKIISSHLHTLKQEKKHSSEFIKAVNEGVAVRRFLDDQEFINFCIEKYNLTNSDLKKMPNSKLYELVSEFEYLSEEQYDDYYIDV